VSGQDIFPLYNNRAELTPDNCEVDSCNEHIGGGGGQPHLHGDPFGTSCLYSAANYSSLSAHPPQVRPACTLLLPVCSPLMAALAALQIGWAYDGPFIYGRYLSTSAPGYSTALDNCGGHTHDSYAYHYHTQVAAGLLLQAQPGTALAHTHHTCPNACRSSQF
jgi:hypothetical protein